MSARHSIAIPGLSHVTAIPVATRIGPLVLSSVIPSFDPGSRTVPPTIEAQVANLFVHAGTMLHAAGASWDDVAKMSFWLVDDAHRAALEAVWIEHFPDPASRPSRHTHVDPHATMASADLTAWVAAGPAGASNDEAG